MLKLTSKHTPFIQLKLKNKLANYPKFTFLNNKLKNGQWFEFEFLILAILVTTAAFFKLGEPPLYEWDESHTVINAIEMLQNGDIINLYYLGEPDEIRAKPPFFIWLVAGSFQLFGFSTFSLRLPSALFTLLAFFFIYRIIRLYQSATFAFYTGLILLAVRGIIGYHVGRTGDFDAMLLAFLMGGTYYFLQYLDFQKEKAIYLSALFFGLAFMTKGPAMAVLLPGLALYILLRQKLSFLCTKRTFWQGIFIAALFPITWFLCIHFYGVTIEQPKYAGSNAFERMFLYDLWERFTSRTFEDENTAADKFYFFRCLEEGFRYWNYAFYLIVLGAIYRFFFRLPIRSFFQNRFKTSTESVHTLWVIFQRDENRLLLLSVCIWLTLGVFLSMVTTAKWWYLAPAIPFIAITTYNGLHWLQHRNQAVRWVFFGLLFFTIGKRYVDSFKTEAPRLMAVAQGYCDLIQESNQVVFGQELPRQDVLGQLYLCSPAVQFKKLDKKINITDASTLILLPKGFYDKNQMTFKKFQVLQSDEYFTILKI